jgi:hypothetical protein
LGARRVSDAAPFGAVDTSVMTSFNGSADEDIVLSSFRQSQKQYQQLMAGLQVCRVEE